MGGQCADLVLFQSHPSLLYIPVLRPSTQRTIQSKQVYRDVHRERESWYDGDAILHGRLMSEDEVWTEIRAHDWEECVRDLMKRCVLFDIEIERREKHQIDAPTQFTIRRTMMDPWHCIHRFIIMIRKVIRRSSIIFYLSFSSHRRVSDDHSWSL